MIVGGLPAFGSSAPPVDPHAAALHILSQARFRVRAPAPKTWWDVFISWLGDRWRDLLEAFGRHVHVGAGTGIAFGDLLLALAIGAVLLVAIRLLAGYVRERSVPSAGAHALDTAASAAHLYAHGEREAAQGRYAAAVTLLFRAALAALDVRGIVRDEPSRTVNECRRDVRARAPRYKEPFDEIARVFSDVLYGDADVTQAQWEQVRSAYLRVARGAQDAA